MFNLLIILGQVFPMDRLDDTAGRLIGVVFIVFLLVGLVLSGASQEKNKKKEDE